MASLGHNKLAALSLVSLESIKISNPINEDIIVIVYVSFLDSQCHHSGVHEQGCMILYIFIDYVLISIKILYFSPLC